VIDLHVHVLPAIDDGATSVAVTEAMLTRARDLGFSVLVATPHLPGPLTPAYRERVGAAHAQARAMGAAVGVEVRLGFEVALTPDLPRRLERGEESTLGGGTAVLVDLPFAGWPHHVEATLFGLQAAGFRPVLAHPERYDAVQRDPALAARLAQRGVALQVTIASTAGVFGKPAQRTAEALLRLGAVHLVATDAHSAGHRLAAVPAGLDRLQALLGERQLARLAVDAPRALLDGAPLPDPPVRPAPRLWAPPGALGRRARRPRG